MPADPLRETFRLGVNYWPARTAMAWWSWFDAGEVARDFERIAVSGLDSMRLFLLWEDFQPQPDRVDRDMLRRLVTVADIAADAGLALMPTLFTGHMSGVNWIPDWALVGDGPDSRFRVVSGARVVAGGLSNWYVDPDVAQAQASLAVEAATALAGHEALWAWDLGNEPSNCVMPPDRERGRRWLEQIASAIRVADDTARITIGLHMEDLEQQRNLGPREAAEACDFLTMHGYPIYASWADGETDEHLVPFLAAVTRWLGGGADVLFSEFGLPTVRGEARTPMLVAEDDAARYTARVLDGLRHEGCAGALVWCHTDYAPAIWDEPPLDEATHERSFGMWRADGSAKPALAELSSFAGRSRLGAPIDDWIDVGEEAYWQDPRAALVHLYGRYRERVTAVRG
ncbi:MAG: glycoside hydrolase 5 family protein [Actinomycetota bacterium]